MNGNISAALLRIAARKKRSPDPPPLLIELFRGPEADAALRYDRYPFAYSVARRGDGTWYSISVELADSALLALRSVVHEVTEAFDPSSVEPLTFAKLIQVLRQLAAESLARVPSAPDRVKALSELVAYEAIGLSRILALAADEFITEFYVDSDSSPVYLDHSNVGRCDTSMVLTERERKALETHIDTFRGYTLDYATPSLKNDLEIAGARLRISLDLEPISVNRFSLDVRRLNITSLSILQLIKMNALSSEATAFLVAWLELGGNVTIIGETGTGKTTLLNALDERLSPKLRRVYIEDAVETRDLLDRGYHQMKIKVDPFERNDLYLRTKGAEIVKVLHRSPDLVILSEIQSEEHSRAFYHALSSGVRGMQTFHASSIEQALRRWTNVHGIPRQSLLDLGVLVQMRRPDRLRPLRFVSRICGVVSEGGEPEVRGIYERDRSFNLQRTASWERIAPPEGKTGQEFVDRVTENLAGLERAAIAS